MTAKFLVLMVISVTIFTVSCEQKKKIKPAEGYMNVPGGKVWYRIVGEGNKIPIVVLHGGPGIPSYYLKPLAALGKDRPVIFYDQLGCGRSDRITDTSLMTVEHFVNELDQVIHHLGLKEYYLYGQSWGTMLATDYYLKHPQAIKALILSSPALSIPMWIKDADTLIKTLPDSVQTVIRTNEQNKSYDAVDYQLAIQVYYQNFVARKLPWSSDIDSCFSQMGENIYKYMGGPSEFTITGELKNYDRTNRLNEIKVPTLFITGEFDEARPSTVKYYQSLVPGARCCVIENSGHLTTQDNPQKNIIVIRDFINSLENK
jgi:proline iminopeptidase